MNPSLRISDIGDFIIIGKANTIHAQLSALAGRYSFNSKEEATQPSRYVHPKAGEVPTLPGNSFQDVDQFAPGYVRGLSKAVL